MDYKHLTSKDLEIIEDVFDKIDQAGALVSLEGKTSAERIAIMAKNVDQSYDELKTNGSLPFLYSHQEIVQRLAFYWGSDKTEVMNRDPNVSYPAIKYTDLETAPLYRTTPDWNEFFEALDYDYTGGTVSQGITYPQLLYTILRNSELAIPQERALDYIYRFQNWLARSNNIQEALYKYFTGVWSEADFKNAIQKYRSTEDYLYGFYDEEIEL